MLRFSLSSDFYIEKNSGTKYTFDKFIITLLYSIYGVYTVKGKAYFLLKLAVNRLTCFNQKMTDEYI